jgi:hypothetical protein
MVIMADNHRKVLDKKWCGCNECPVCYAKRALDFDFSGEVYVDVFTEAIKAVEREELTEELYIAVEVFREKVRNKPESSPRDRRGRTPASGVKRGK